MALLPRQQEFKTPSDLPTFTTPMIYDITVTKLPSTSILQVTMWPWPTGFEFPSIPPTGPITIAAGSNQSWYGMNVTVASNQHAITMDNTISSTFVPPRETTDELDSVTLASSTSFTIPTTPSNMPITSTSAPGPESGTSNTSITQLPLSTVTPTASTIAKTDNRGLSNGAIAGIAIGSLLAGAFLAGCLVWLCLGRGRRRSRGRDQGTSALVFLPREKGATAVNTRSIESESPTSKAIDNALPQPLEDRSISGEVAKLESSIKNHVQSYYHYRSVGPGGLDLGDLQGLGNNLPVSTGTLGTLLGNSGTRDIALRFVIAWVMISRMELHSDPDATFLPLEVSKCFQIMSNSDGGSRAHSFLLSNWRRISAELLQSAYSQSLSFPSDARNGHINAALGILDAILEPFADGRMDNVQRRRNLEEILKRAANFAFTLFAHPSTWTFDWKEEQGVKSGSLCIFPALLQISDETGESIKPPRQFSEAVVRTLDE